MLVVDALGSEGARDVLSRNAIEFYKPQESANDLRVSSGRVFCVRLQRCVERGPAAARTWIFNQLFWYL